MKTIVIDVESNSSAKFLMELAKKLNFTARVLSKNEKEDAALLAVMLKRKSEPGKPVTEAMKALKKIK